MKKQIQLIESKNIYDYTNAIDGLFEDEGFGYPFVETMLIWCGVMTSKPDGKFWQVWVIKYGDKKIGVCGLFSHSKKTNELWLGWFGIHPKFRNKKLGSQVLVWMENHAKQLGCNKILSYVDKRGKPLPFYYKQGYKKSGTVKQYLKSNPKANRDEFEDLQDYVIYKSI